MRRGAPGAAAHVGGSGPGRDASKPRLVSLEVGTPNLGAVLAPSDQVAAVVTAEPQESPTASTLAGTVDASGGENSSRSLVREGGDPHVWGGPRIQWADRRDPKATAFALADEVEAGEWRSLHTQVRALMGALTNVLSSLGDTIALVGQV